MIDGTFTFVYGGTGIGNGIGAFTVTDGILIGTDMGGCKYNGTVTEDFETKEITIEFEHFVPAGISLVQGTSAQETNYIKKGLRIRLRPNYGNGAPTTVNIPPGDITLMISRTPDEFAAYAKGFELVLKER